MDISKDHYAKRIIAATPLQLVIINYEIILDYLQHALAELQENKDLDKQQFCFYIQRAKDFLNELITGLDFNFDIAKQLVSIYSYINKLLIGVVAKPSAQAVEEAIKILERLLSSWVQLEKDHSKDQKPMLENASKLYAGLTYNSKGVLGEYSEESKGYRV